MKNIVVITTGEASKRHFANRLNKLSGGRVSLVIIQKFKRKSLRDLYKKTLERVGALGVPKEFWYAALCKLNPDIRRVLQYFRGRTINDGQNGHYSSPVLETFSVNSDEVEEAIKKVSPSLIVVWGGGILKPKILRLAPKIINMHFGWCPEYRGSNGNQNAILNDDLEHVGITIHYVKEKVDTGDILARVRADVRIPPREMFINMNDSSAEKYLDIALRLFREEPVTAQSQDLSVGKTYFFREWSYKKEYGLAKKLLDWEGRMDK